MKESATIDDKVYSSADTAIRARKFLMDVCRDVTDVHHIFVQAI